MNMLDTLVRWAESALNDRRDVYIVVDDDLYDEAVRKCRDIRLPDPWSTRTVSVWCSENWKGKPFSLEYIIYSMTYNKVPGHCDARVNRRKSRG